MHFFFRWSSALVLLLLAQYVFFNLLLKIDSVDHLTSDNAFFFFYWFYPSKRNDQTSILWAELGKALHVCLLGWGGGGGGDNQAQCNVYIHLNTVWCHEIGSLASLDACSSGASSDIREPISLHRAVLIVVWKWATATHVCCNHVFFVNCQGTV